MRSPSLQRLIKLTATTGLVVAALGSGAPAGTDIPRSTRTLVPMLPGCAVADIERLPLPQGAAVDEIRVVVSPWSPAASAADVTVLAGDFDRIVRVRGRESRSLAFSPPLVADSGHLAVALEPLLDDASPAPCVERIDLLHGGTVVGTVHPR
jgi:hypothetical protein